MLSLNDVKSSIVFDYFLTSEQQELFSTAKSVFDVEQIIKSYPQYNWLFVKKRIEKVKRTVDKLNKSGYEKDIFFTDGIISDKYSYVDKLNKGSVLILNSITGKTHSKFKEIKDLTIEEIKELLTYIDGYGNNYLKSIMHGVGDIHIKLLINAIRLYEEQVDRQSSLCSLSDNVFMVDKKEKFNISHLNIERIIKFLVSQERPLIWGSLSSNMKDVYMSSISSNSDRSLNIKNEICDVISNYTTLDELVSFNSGNIKVLYRFVS